MLWRKIEQERGSECWEMSHFILVQDGSGRLAERWCVSKDLKLNQKDPSLPETQSGTCRMPRVAPDSPAVVSSRGRQSSGPHTKFQFRSINITSFRGWSCPTVN